MNSKFILCEGEGSLKCLRSFQGGLPNVYAYLQGGRGGQKWPKSCLRSKSMTPYKFLLEKISKTFCQEKTKMIIAENQKIFLYFANWNQPQSPMTYEYFSFNQNNSIITQSFLRTNESTIEKSLWNNFFEKIWNGIKMHNYRRKKLANSCSFLKHHIYHTISMPKECRVLS